MIDLSIANLRTRYLSGELTLHALFDQLLPILEDDDVRHIWIRRLTGKELAAYVDALSGKSPIDLPLYGVPFAIKDNIDLACVETTAACPQFSYLPQRSATVVQKLIDAGAIPVGKTNLDQFATGLVGVRSPYGAARNSFHPDYISGGSSSGSAIAVALGMASFSLGTDTAGSGRVPAAFNNLIGLKPTCGVISTTGVVPACRSLDTISIFALNADDARLVLSVAAGEDATDPLSRSARPYAPSFASTPKFKLGTPRADQLEFFGDDESRRLYEETLADLGDLGAEPVEIDFAPFQAAARLLYEGPFVAERYAGIRSFFDEQPHALHPITRDIVVASKAWSAADLFDARIRLAELKKMADTALDAVDCLVTPTAGTIYRVAEVEADPIRLNSNLGYYTNFLNLFDYAAIAVPAGFSSAGLPYGVTLVAQAHADGELLDLARRLHPKRASKAGATPFLVNQTKHEAVRSVQGYTNLAVCAAHLTGLPLNHQLTDRGAHLVSATRSAARYKLLALPGGPPYRAGMIRYEEGGASIALEVWAMPTVNLGSFLTGIPAPLGLGTVELADGTSTTGFICEGYVEAASRDITSYGGWRAYLDSRGR